MTLIDKIKSHSPRQDMSFNQNELLKVYLNDELIWEKIREAKIQVMSNAFYSDPDCKNTFPNTTYMVDFDTKFTFPVVYKPNQGLVYWKNQSTGQITSNNEAVISEDGTWFPVFETGKYTVTFDTNGGVLDGKTKTLLVTYGVPYGKLPIPTKEGYGFDGWFTAKSGGTKIVDTNTVKTGNNHTLYAHWSAYDLIKWNITPGSMMNVKFTKSIQQITIPAGKYLLEAYGASGGLSGHNKNATYGGYAGGYFETNKAVTLYVVVGGQGVSQGSGAAAGSVLAGGYNGAGNGAEAQSDSSGGGSATHIALVPGLLPELESQKDKILIVGGGAGGNGCSAQTGGHGGYGNNQPGANGMAFSGGRASGGGTITSGGIGGMNSGSGSFGQGGSTGLTQTWPGAGGGSGYYGGGAGDNLSGGGGSGAGGSSFANSKYITNPANTYTGGPNTGNGYAILKCIELY